MKYPAPTTLLGCLLLCVLPSCKHASLLEKDPQQQQAAVAAAPEQVVDEPGTQLQGKQQLLFAQQLAMPASAAALYVSLPSEYFSDLQMSAKRRLSYVYAPTASYNFLQSTMLFEHDGTQNDLSVRVFRCAGRCVGAVLLSNQEKLHEQRSFMLGAEPVLLGFYDFPDFRVYGGKGWVAADSNIFLGAAADNYQGLLQNLAANLDKLQSAKHVGAERQELHFSYELDSKQGCINLVTHSHDAGAPKRIWQRYFYTPRGFVIQNCR